MVPLFLGKVTPKNFPSLCLGIRTPSHRKTIGLKTVGEAVFFKIKISADFQPKVPQRHPL